MPPESNELGGAGGKDGLIGTIARGPRTGKQSGRDFSGSCAETLGNFVAQQAASAKSPGFYGADPYAQSFRGFAGGELADFGEVHDGLQDGAEFVDRAGQDVANFELAILLFRRCGLVLDFEREAFLVNRLMAFDRKVARTALAKKHQGFVDGDAGEPGGEPRLALKTF